MLKTNLRAMRDAINQFYADKGHYPPSLDALVEEEYLRAVPWDPIARSSDTWVVEYEEIDPDFEAPRRPTSPRAASPGSSTSSPAPKGSSLDDGTPYSEW